VRILDTMQTNDAYIQDHGLIITHRSIIQRIVATYSIQAQHFLFTNASSPILQDRFVIRKTPQLHSHVCQRPFKTGSLYISTDFTSDEYRNPMSRRAYPQQPPAEASLPLLLVTDSVTISSAEVGWIPTVFCNSWKVMPFFTATPYP
jgi:hypothetical protein